MDVEKVYLSMLGELLEPVPGVENAFVPGQLCEVLYQQVYDANRRLCQRLGVEEDADVECIVDCFFEITRELCLRMYRMGAELG